jgi:hypothetical protein
VERGVRTSAASRTVLHVPSIISDIEVPSALESLEDTARQLAEALDGVLGRSEVHYHDINERGSGVYEGVARRGA